MNDTWSPIPALANDHWDDPGGYDYPYINIPKIVQLNRVPLKFTSMGSNGILKREDWEGAEK